MMTGTGSLNASGLAGGYAGCPRLSRQAEAAVLVNVW